MVTLLILSLLVIIAVSFLSSMSAEHQAADAYGASADAEQAARAAVDSATAMLAECLRDFPDSATVWDPQQSINYGSPASSLTVNSPYNEGTSLYLRAVPSAQDSTAYAVALPSGVTYTQGGTSYAANDPQGNTPSNPACENFVLPLISGWLSGHARLSTARTQYYMSSPGPTASVNSFPPAMNLNEPDPTKQNWVDLNVRRFGKSGTYPNGDLQGAIGSPPTWTGAGATSGMGPKPARAYWVNVKGSDGLISSRYAFWIDDESFRLNTSLAGATGQPSANTVWPTDASTGKIRASQPGDLALAGPLIQALDGNATNDAGNIVTARASYPGNFFPDPLAFSHEFDGTTPPTQLIDTVRYLTTNQSGALNLTRHGSQRLNLNSTISTTTNRTAIQLQVDQLVQTMQFHLPYFGERFYRTGAGTDSTTLNATNTVLGSPKTPHYPATSDNAEIYYYKVAANLRDYVDADNQPTVVMSGGQVASVAAPTGPLEADNAPSQANEFWAQGKESTPLIQEVAVRYRPVVVTSSNTTGSTYPKGHYELQVDYYIELWNMTNRDIYAAPQTGANSALPTLNNATIWVRDQQTWDGYPAGNLLAADGSTTGETLTNDHSPNDWQIDLTNSVANGNNVSQPNGVVFRAGTVTVITTDPNCATYTYKELSQSGGASNNPGLAGTVANPANMYYCQLVSGQRKYTGMVTNSTGTTSTDGGLMFGSSFGSAVYSGTEVSLVNQYGYLDVARGAITKIGGPGTAYYTNTDKYVGTQGGYNDFSFGSSLMGNVSNAGQTATPSQLGDPRTNNEQLSISINNATVDGSHYVISTHTLGSPNWATLQPATTATGQAWGDYYTLPTGSAHPNADASNAPVISADAPLTSIGQLGDVFDPARLPDSAGIAYSRGGGRTFKIGQHDDRYSNDPSGNPSNAGPNNVSASNGWASWRLADIFDVADPIELPGRININGVQRDNGAALLAMLQGFRFQPTTATTATTSSTDQTVHGDGVSGLAAQLLGQSPYSASNPNQPGFAQIVTQMIARFNNTTPANGPSGPFFERGELGELGTGTSLLFGINPTTSSSSNNLLVSSVDMNKTMDHSREELFRRIAQMICTRGDTFTVYATGQSIMQPPGTTAATADTATKKITGTQRMRVTFRLVPQQWHPSTNSYIAFNPAYTTKTDGSGQVGQVSSFDPTSPTGLNGVTARFAKPDRYNVQVLQVVVY